MKKTICLNMIVRNESHVITRCLDSVKDHIDYWLISDTGSTDGTQEIITNYFSAASIPGQLTSDPWHDFATNRNLALDAATGVADYILIMDADDVLELPNGWGDLEADCYSLQLQLGNIHYAVPKLIRATLPWRWSGVVHEHLVCSAGFNAAQHEGRVLASTEGSRGRNPLKYLEDARVLELALCHAPDNTRYQFYLAQSYRDAGTDSGKLLALEHYRRRAAMGGFQEEVYCSLLEAAHLLHGLAHPYHEVLEAYMEAMAYRPQRLEAAYHAVRLCRENGLFHLGWQLGRAWQDTQQPDDVLFVDRSVYAWRFRDEISICAVYAGQVADAARLMQALLDSAETPAAERDRISNNLAFARSAFLSPAANPATENRCNA